MHNFVPDLHTKEIIDYMTDIGIEIRQSDLLRPTNSMILRLYESMLTFLTNTEFTSTVDESLYQIILYKKMCALMSKIGFVNFSIKDFNAESRRLISILSYVVNFSMYRDTKKNVYEKIKSINDEKKIMKEEIDRKIKNKKKEIATIKNNLQIQSQNKISLENELVELDKELKEIIKIQRNLVNETENYKNERDELNDKLNSYQLLFMNLKQDIECLKTQIVSDPTKLVSLLKEMKELLTKEFETLKNLESDNLNLINKINNLQTYKEFIKNLINKANELKILSLEIEKMETCITEIEIKNKSIESSINASKIRVNYILRQIGHIESKINNLQDIDEKCSNDMSQKMSVLKGDYSKRSFERNSMQNKIDENIRECKAMEYEIMKHKNNHECYVNDIINLLNNIKDSQYGFFTEIRKNL